jgi:hypothetical protein
MNKETCLNTSKQTHTQNKRNPDNKIVSQALKAKIIQQ